MYLNLNYCSRDKNNHTKSRSDPELELGFSSRELQVVVEKRMRLLLLAVKVYCDVKVMVEVVIGYANVLVVLMVLDVCTHGDYLVVVVILDCYD